MFSARLATHYHLRSLSQRRWSMIATLLGVALVVGVFCYLLSFANGLRRALAVSGDARNVLVIAEGATAESNSAVTHEEVGRLMTVPHVAIENGRTLVSPEVVVQTNVTRRGDAGGAFASVAVRGVDLDVATQVRARVKLTEGRWFRAGQDELVVGAAAARQFNAGAIGARLECGDRTFDVVGVFAAGSGAHESEFWGHVSNVAAAYKRDMYSTAVVRLDSTEDAARRAALARIASSGVALRGVPEQDYYAAQTQNARVVRDLALVIVAAMGFGAVFAAMNAMHAAIARRGREIAMLRAIGFAPRRIARGLIGESILVTLTGGLLGCAACSAYVWLTDATRDLVGTTTFTSVAFSVRTSAVEILYSLAVAVVIGLLGGWWPARRATRVPITQAIRAA